MTQSKEIVFLFPFSTPFQYTKINMNSSKQITNDELIAIMLAKSEAEQYDQNINYIEDEIFSHPAPVRRRANQNFNYLEFNPMQERFDDFFQDFSNEHKYEAVDDSIPIEVLMHMFENSTISPNPRHPEEVKHRPANQNQRLRNPNPNPSPGNRNLIQHTGKSIATSGTSNPSMRTQANNRSQNPRTQRSQTNNRVQANPRNPGQSRVKSPIEKNNFIDEPGNYMLDDEEHQPSYEQLLELDEKNYDKGNGFSESQLRRLIAFEFNEKMNKDGSSCPICMNDFRRLQKVIKLKCEHLYHDSCIKEWLARKKVCVVCKFEVKI